MPAFRALAQGFIVIIAGLLDQALQTDEASNFISVLVKAEKRQQARYSSVTIAKRVHAEEVEHQRRDAHQKLSLLLVQGFSVREAQLFHSSRCVGNGNWSKTNRGGCVLAELDNLILFLLP